MMVIWDFSLQAKWLEKGLKFSVMSTLPYNCPYPIWNARASLTVKEGQSAKSSGGVCVASAERNGIFQNWLQIRAGCVHLTNLEPHWPYYKCELCLLLSLYSVQTALFLFQPIFCPRKEGRQGTDTLLDNIKFLFSNPFSLKSREDVNICFQIFFFFLPLAKGEKLGASMTCKSISCSTFKI